MGYDIYRVDGAGENIKPQEGVNRWDDEKGSDLQGPLYFRRNIFGMAPLREALDEFGLGYWSNVPDFPEIDASTLPKDEYGDPDYERSVDYMRHLTSTFNETPGIALHKFTSNDGWWVTAAEWRSMLQLLSELEPERRAAFLANEAVGTDFIPFAQACANSGGARVW